MSVIVFLSFIRQGIELFSYNGKKMTGVLSIALFHQEGLYSSA